MTKLTNDQIVSFITGKTVEELEKIGYKDKQIWDQSRKLMLLIGHASKTDKDLIAHLCTLICMSIHPFKIETRLKILEMVGKVSLTETDNKICDMIKKFKNDDTNNTS